MLPDASAGLLCDRYYQGLCAGPCAGREPQGDYEQRLHQRDALLGGVDDASLCELEQRVERLDAPSGQDAVAKLLDRRARTLRQAFDHAATLRRAEELVHGWLLLPGSDDRRNIAVMTLEGIRFDVLENRPGDAGRLLARHRPPAHCLNSDQGRRLPVAAMDALCIAAREQAKAPHRYRVLTARRIARLDEPALLDAAFHKGEPTARAEVGPQAAAG